MATACGDLMQPLGAVLCQKKKPRRGADGAEQLYLGTQWPPKVLKLRRGRVGGGKCGGQRPRLSDRGRENFARAYARHIAERGGGKKKSRELTRGT